MNDDNYHWKSRPRQPAPQWLSWVGISLSLAVLFCVAWLMMWTGEEWTTHTRQQTESIRECLNAGRTAINTEHGVACE